MRNKTGLVNLTNIHGGGALQVAISFVEELSHFKRLPIRLTLIVSTEVHLNLQEIKCDLSNFHAYEVFDSHGISALWSSLRHKLQEFEVVFTLFGPLYIFPIKAVNIIGFAQPWIIYPNNEISIRLPPFKKIRTKFKFYIQEVFFKFADKLIVELEHVKENLINRGITNSNIAIVYNSLNSLYSKPECWVDVKIDNADSVFNIGLICRDYPHKNTDILPKVKEKLAVLYNISVNFYVTLTDNEWSSKSPNFRKNIKNVGELRVVQCPDFYRKMDAIIFPSFLECFSATPLEAMFMSKPLFASDRGFIRDVCGDYAHYFDPENADDIAKVIATYFLAKQPVSQQKIKGGAKYVSERFSPTQRAISYLNIMQTCTKKNKA